MNTYTKITNSKFSAIRSAWAELDDIERALLAPLVRCNSFAAIGDLYEHGANTGWAGLTYCYEMADFCKEHAQEVIAKWGEHLEYMTKDLGCTFEDACIIKPFDGYSVAEVMGDVYSGAFEFTGDGLCWLFAELGAQKFVDKIEEMEG